MKQRLQYYKNVPFSRLWSLYAAVFCLFALTGFFGDMLNLGKTPYGIVFLNAFCSGFIAVMYLHVGTKLDARYFLHATLLQIPFWLFFTLLVTVITRYFRLQPVDTSSGVRIAGGAMLVLVIISYTLFIRFLRGEGAEALRLRNELELAHGIQKTLVPPVSLRAAGFELYGRSDPSEQVGGDLVDVVIRDDGSVVAYVADVAGHGLQAGILMGMVKTAARTALLEPDRGTSEPVLSSVMERLNRVLPGVKEAQMYATFAGFSLHPDGRVIYALAAHPPLLHYGSDHAVAVLATEQFPLGLLPVSDFPVAVTTMASGDLLVAVTDGVLEACNAAENEFGLERLRDTVASHTQEALEPLADRILKEVRAFGTQTDDQTLLLIRRL